MIRAEREIKPRGANSARHAPRSECHAATNEDDHRRRHAGDRRRRGAGIAAAKSGGNEEDATEAPIVGPDLDRASAAALEHTGGGRVTGTEIGDEESYYEVAVTLGDGRQVDVQLDEQFSIVSDKADDDAAE